MTRVTISAPNDVVKAEIIRNLSPALCARNCSLNRAADDVHPLTHEKELRARLHSANDVTCRRYLTSRSFMHKRMLIRVQLPPLVLNCLHPLGVLWLRLPRSVGRVTITHILDFIVFPEMPAELKRLPRASDSHINRRGAGKLTLQCQDSRLASTFTQGCMNHPAICPSSSFTRAPRQRISDLVGYHKYLKVAVLHSQLRIHSLWE